MSADGIKRFGDGLPAPCWLCVVELGKILVRDCFVDIKKKREKDCTARIVSNEVSLFIEPDVSFIISNGRVTQNLKFGLRTDHLSWCNLVPRRKDRDPD